MERLQVRLTEETVDLAAGAQAVCVFVNDEVTEKVMERLSEVGVRCVALRCAGYDALLSVAAQNTGPHEHVCWIRKGYLSGL